MPEWKTSTQKINGDIQESEICILGQSLNLKYITLSWDLSKRS